MSNTPRTDAYEEKMLFEGLADSFRTRNIFDTMRDLERELGEAVAIAERLGEGLSYDSPERRARDLEAFHEWQFNRAKQRPC